MTFSFSELDLCAPALHPPGTLVIKTWGQGAARCTHRALSRQLGALSGTNPADFHVWRGENPNRWFSTAPPTLHGTTGTIDTFNFNIEQMEKETTRATLHWLPATVKNAALQRLVDTELGEGCRIERDGHRPDQARVYVPKRETDRIPHYIACEFKGETFHVLMTIPGRRTVCRHCGDTTHWASQCPTYTQRPPRAPNAQQHPKPTAEEGNATGESTTAAAATTTAAAAAVNGVTTTATSAAPEEPKQQKRQECGEPQPKQQKRDEPQQRRRQRDTQQQQQQHRDKLTQHDETQQQQEQEQHKQPQQQKQQTAQTTPLQQLRKPPAKKEAPNWRSLRPETTYEGKDGENTIITKLGDSGIIYSSKYLRSPPHSPSPRPDPPPLFPH